MNLLVNEPPLDDMEFINKEMPKIIARETVRKLDSLKWRQGVAAGVVEAELRCRFEHAMRKLHVLEKAAQ